MSHEGVSWRHLSAGLNLIGFGVFLMLTTLGVLPWSFWLDVARLWPVLLIGMGLRLIFERSALRWAVLASPLLIQGTLAWAALQPPTSFAGEWVEVRAARPEGAERWTLDAELAVGRLDVRSRAVGEGLLAEGRAAVRDGRPSLSLARRSGGPRVRLRHGGRQFDVFARERQRWEVDVARELPIGVDLETAFVRGRLDLAEAPVTWFRLDGAFNDVVVVLGAPQHDTKLVLEGAFNDVELHVPATTPIRVRTDGPLLAVDGRPDERALSGPAYELRLSGFASRVTVLPAPGADDEVSAGRE